MPKQTTTSPWIESRRPTEKDSYSRAKLVWCLMRPGGDQSADVPPEPMLTHFRNVSDLPWAPIVPPNDLERSPECETGRKRKHIFHVHCHQYENTPHSTFDERENADEMAEEVGGYVRHYVEVFDDSDPEIEAVLEIYRQAAEIRGQVGQISQQITKLLLGK